MAYPSLNNAPSPSPLPQAGEGFMGTKSPKGEGTLN